jgi:arylsulfatase A-like enzyme
VAQLFLIWNPKPILTITMLVRLLFYVAILSCLLACANKELSETTQKRAPNILLIMADDLGYGDIACYGNETIRTPNLDKLASGGVKFTDYHSNGVVCSPTRAALLTGNYQQRTGIEGVVTAKNHRHVGFQADLSLAAYFKEQNYKTGIIGKWHLGYDTLFSPQNNGFDYFKGYVSGNIDYHSHIDQEGYFDWWEGKDTLSESGYSTDLITSNSIDFIAKNMEQNFFLYVAHEAPHYPYQGRNDPADRTIQGQFNNLGSRTDRERAYAEMIEIMDEGIGTLVDYLDKHELLEHTLILFVSDNGASKLGSNGPYKGFKGNVWEGGHRVPAIAYWENTISPGVIDQTLMSMDIFPTLLELVGAGDQQDRNFDGQSFLPLLMDSTAVIESRTLFWRFGDSKKAVRAAQWKYINFEGQEYLYDLDKDPGEAQNLKHRFPTIRDSLRYCLAEWEKEMSGYKRITF